MHLSVSAWIYEAHQILSTFQLIGKVKSATCPGKVNFCPHGGREKLENTIHWTRLVQNLKSKYFPPAPSVQVRLERNFFYTNLPGES